MGLVHGDTAKTTLPGMAAPLFVRVDNPGMAARAQQHSARARSHAFIEM
jgi:hypothetical protein